VRALLRIASWIDRLSEVSAAIVCWALLANALLITTNAISRKFLAMAWPTAFDMQWHFFAAVVLLMAAAALRRDEHVRIDVFAHRLGDRGLARLDLAGILFVLLPVCIVMVWLSGEQFLQSLIAGETRASRESVSDLPAWIIKGFIPLGLLLLALQGSAEAVRCVAALKGLIQRPIHRSQLIQRRDDDR
jgi:TRAP-type mannitol/chloroaromatic compound transport system permease small subunit